MQTDAGQFELSFKQQKIQVQKHAVGGQTILELIFSIPPHHLSLQKQRIPILIISGLLSRKEG